jgi:hypothetical protein
VTLHPSDDKQNVLMAGCSDKKIYQFDIDKGEVVQVGTPKSVDIPTICQTG